LRRTALCGTVPYMARGGWKTVNVREELYERVAAAADADSRSVTQAVEWALEAMLAKGGVRSVAPSQGEAGGKRRSTSGGFQYGPKRTTAGRPKREGRSR
jgi:hypothetical protein